MGIPYDTRLPADLRALKEEIEGYARGYGLDFYETIFEVIDADDLNEIAAYGGFPTRYPHWSYGMAYEELKKGYEYGLSKIYEMVINNDPCYAYLMRCNHTVDQKLVMAHVYGHCDFFKNNAYFAHTNRKMMDEMANHGARIRRYVEKYGEDEVEAFLDRCKSIDDLIDIHSTAIRRRDESSRYNFNTDPDTEDEIKLTRFKSKTYMDDYINPKEALRAEEEERRRVQEEAARSFPERPEKDVLLFLIDYAPLKPWQRDVLSIIRDEAYYFAPQAQTKIINEGWACVTAGSLVYTSGGLRRIEEVVDQRLAAQVYDGSRSQPIYDWAKFADRETVWVRTRRGLELEGSLTHRLLLPDGSWRSLSELRPGDQVCVAGGGNLWATEYVYLDEAREYVYLDEASGGRKSPDNVLLHRQAYASCSLVSCGNSSSVNFEYETGLATATLATNKRRAIRVPEILNESLAAFLGYLIGDGHISATKRVIGLSSGAEEPARRFAELTEELFGIVPRIKGGDGRYRVLFSARHVEDFLKHLGLPTGVSARTQDVPAAILQSPKSVVAAFLRAYFDCNGHAGKTGVILSTSSESMSKTVQLLLLNFGILSSRRAQPKGCWHVHITGSSAAVFEQEIGFGSGRKQAVLQNYIAERRWFKEESWEDTIVASERRRADVYDISVADTHRYAAQGFINHNSYWHSTIMTECALEPWECIDYADHHSGTMASSGRLNPYKLGIELLRDIEHRWNTGKFGKEYEECDDLDKRRNWNTQLGLGRQKIFEVRRVHNDITFIDTFLTPEFCREHKLFSFAYHDSINQYVIESREFEKVKQRLLFSLTNFGMPWIYVVDGNYRNRGELLLKHEHNGIDLRIDWAKETLTNLQVIWSRPVHLQTIVDNKPTLLSFDGSEHTQKTTGETDDAKRSASGKTG